MDQQTTTNEQNECKVNLEVFEGPLDLLLYLLKKNDLEIEEIKVALITEEYLKFLDAMKELDVNVAGEYLLMAAELVQMKSKMLLPIDSEGEIDALEEDPTEELKRRLLEYQRYKEASNTLGDLPVLNRDEFVQLSPESMPDRPEILAQENVFKLLEAFQFMLKKMPSDMVQEVTIDRVSVNEKIYQLLDLIKSNQTIPIENLLPETYEKYDLVVTFLALLEMCKLMMIKVFQAGKFQKIYITGRMEEVSQEEALKLVDSENITSEG